MRFNPLLPISPWPYLLTEPTISLQGDMSQGELPTQHDTFLKSPNLSMDSGFEGERHFSQSDATDETHSWLKESSLDSSPQSPKKLTDDSDFNESPLDKKPSDGAEDIPSSVRFNYVKEQESKSTTDANGCLEEDHLCTVLSFSYFANEEVTNSESGASCTGNGQCTSPNCAPFGFQESLVTNEDDKSCDENCTDDTLSFYYIPSIASITTDDCYAPSVTSSETLKEDSPSHPPIPPPRTSKSGKVCRKETLSEADACCSSGSAYKSLRSLSDPSTHYTTVLKPKAIRPPPINLDRFEYRASFESLHTSRASAAFVQYRDCSAFQQHLHCVLSNGGDGSSLFSHPLNFTNNVSSGQPLRVSETPPGTSRSVSWSAAPRAASLTDISNRESLHMQHADVASQCSSSPKEKLSKLDVTPEPSENSSENLNSCSESKRHSMPWDLFWTASPTIHHRPLSAHQSDTGEPIHMTLEEVRSSLQTLRPQTTISQSNDNSPSSDKRSPCRHFFKVYFRNRKSRKNEKCLRNSKDATEKSYRRSFPSSLKSAIASWFKLKKAASVDERTFCQSSKQPSAEESVKKASPNTSPFTNRALPPLPRDSPACSVHMWEPSITVREESSSISSSSDSENDSNHNKTSRKIDYAASIEKVKDYGWYWGPIGGETAENLLANEPDGSFVVRDSSDEHYIFSLTFKLNGLVRHVRIEHDHGNFSFGCLQKFRSNTIVDFIENAVEHSRSGRYLFFLHRRPILGPMRVQLLHPVSRFKQVQSLQHLCRFVILKVVRRDLITQLPLPRRLKDYLNTPHYYSEELEQLSHQSSRTEGDQQASRTT